MSDADQQPVSQGNPEPEQPEPEQQPDRGPEPGSDEWVEGRLRELRAIVQLKKRELVVQLREGDRDNSGRAIVSVGDLAAIDRLEQKLAVRTRVQRVRLATRLRD